MSSALQNILILGGIILLAGLGYYLFVQKDAGNLNNVEVDGQAAMQTAQFLKRLNDLEQMSFDGAIFSDPRFTTLISFSKEVQPEPYGKANPFIPEN
mgnify:CR=1 FL=1